MAPTPRGAGAHLELIAAVLLDLIAEVEIDKRLVTHRLHIMGQNGEVAQVGSIEAHLILFDLGQVPLEPALVYRSRPLDAERVGLDVCHVHTERWLWRKG